MARKSRKHADVQTEAAYRAALYVRTAFYIRLSVEDNKKHGYSLETQRLILEDYAARYPEMEMCGTYVDNGATGTNFDRPGFRQMLADIEAGKINCVIVKDLSRLGRNVIDTGYYIERYFPAHKVRFISVNDNFDTDNPDNLFGGIVLPLKNMINEAYSIDIGKKIKAQARQSMRDGEYIGGRAPYGYKKDPANCHKLLVDEEAAAVVRQIFEWAYHKAGLNDIVRRLNDAGILPPSNYKQAQGLISHDNLIGSGRWQTRTVQKILDSEIYTGDLVQGKTKIIDHRQVKAGADNLVVVHGTHEAIISREMFEAVASYRRQVAKDSKKSSQIPYTPNIFKGRIFCGQCGISLHRQRNRGIYHYRCITRNRVRKDACVVVSIKERNLTAAVLEILRGQIGTLVDHYLELRKNGAFLKARNSRITAEILSLKQDLEKNRRFLRGLYENLVRGTLTNEEYFTLKAGYEAKISTDRERAAALEAGLSKLDSELKQYDDLARDAQTLKAGCRLTVDLVEKLVERIDVFPDKQIRVKPRFQNELAGLEEVLGECKSM